MIESVGVILADDGYRRLRSGEEPLPGDLVMYHSGGGVVEHVGVVLEVRKVGREVVPLIMSKWGPGPEYLHAVARSPYGSDYEYLTERP